MQRELAVCEKYQISHSHYLGGPAGWTALDRAKAEEYAAWAAQTCQQCGTRPEWWDPKRGGHRFAFLADMERCPGCEVKEQMHEQMREAEREDGGGSYKGVHVVLVPNPDVYGPPPGTDPEGSAA